MISIRTDTTNIRSTLRALQRSAPLATQDSVIVTTSAVLRRAGTQSAARFHRGTNRMARGWLRASNGLAIGNAHLAEFGVRPMALPMLRNSDMVQGAYQLLRTKAERNAAKIAHLRAVRQDLLDSPGFASGKAGEGSRWATIRRLTETIDRASEYQVAIDNRTREFEAAMRKTGAVVMFGKRTKKEFGLSSIERIYPNELGCTVRIVSTANRASAEVEHHEPHARIVESRTRIYASALADVKSETGGLVSTGTGREADAFFKRIGTGMAPGTRVVRGSGGRLFVRR